ncbi:hypothetical protein HY498_00350 [Candidatus Woesearchaeota archaeon]|nr:hypothetical protein [Candidatus Woesearchaeota archaeon]
MKSGIKYSLLEIDNKGRIHIPIKLRKNIGLGNQVLAEIEKKAIILRPLERIENPVEFLSSLNVKTKKTPVEMKREAELVFS